MRETPRWFLRVGGTVAILMIPMTSNVATGAGAPRDATPATSPAAATQPSGPAATSPAAAALAAYQQRNQRVIRFLEDRVRQDPDDIISHNRLAGLYLQRARDTGSVDYIQLAEKAVHKSLASVQADQNAGAVAMKARVEFESHEFAAARDTATRLIGLEPDKPYPYGYLGDALAELGDYGGAAAAYEKMRAIDEDGVGTLSRLGRLAQLRGDDAGAAEKLSAALDAAARSFDTSPEPAAWCRWQLGELAFAGGDYPAAERWYREALDGLPGYFRALASLGRVRAARGDLADAIRQYEHAVAVVPDPTFLAALGDLYHLAGREREAQQQYTLVEQVARLSKFRGVLYNRQVALFWADHGLRPDEAYASAAKEYDVRKDIYGADAVAWTALKAGKLPEARAAARETLRLGTHDARLYYHAGMIELAAGDHAAAVDYLSRARRLSPQFDPLQAVTCAKSLEAANAAVHGGASR